WRLRPFFLRFLPAGRARRPCWDCFCSNIRTTRGTAPRPPPPLPFPSRGRRDSAPDRPPPRSFHFRSASLSPSPFRGVLTGVPWRLDRYLTRAKSILGDGKAFDNLLFRPACWPGRMPERNGDNC